MPEPRHLPVLALAPEVALDPATAADLAQVAIVWRETRDALLDPLVARQADVAVVSLLDQTGASVAKFVEQVHKRNTRLRIVVDMPATRAALQQIPGVLGAGAAEVSVRGFDRLSDVIRMVLTPNWQPGAALALLDLVPPIVPESLKPFAVACALKGSPQLTVELAADWAETSPRTVRSQLQQTSLSPPAAFIRYCSAAHAMCLLYPQGVPAGQVVERMRFGSGRALRDLIQAYLSDAPKDLPQRWAYGALLARCGEFLRQPPVRLTLNVELDLERLERYLNGDLMDEERFEFERWVTANALTEAGDAGERLRHWSAARGLEPDPRQRHQEIWAQLLRSMGSEFRL